MGEKLPDIVEPVRTDAVPVLPAAASFLGATGTDQVVAAELATPEVHWEDALLARPVIEEAPDYFGPSWRGRIWQITVYTSERFEVPGYEGQQLQVRLGNGVDWVAPIRRMETYISTDENQDLKGLEKAELLPSALLNPVRAATIIKLRPYILATINIQDRGKVERYLGDHIARLEASEAASVAMAKRRLRKWWLGVMSEADVRSSKPPS